MPWKWFDAGTANTGTPKHGSAIIIPHFGIMVWIGICSVKMISAPTENERTVTGMADYIEREAAYKTIMGEPPDAHYPQWYADKILSIHAADVAPVRYGQWNVEWDA